MSNNKIGSNVSENYPQEINRSVGKQALEVLEIIGDVIILLIKILYYVCQSAYKKIIPPVPKPVNGKIVVITGTGHGIGRELAFQYAAEGAIVVGIDINRNGNEETFKEIVKRGFQMGHFYTCDVSIREQVLDVGKQITKEIGEVDILINNAGIMPCHPLEKHSPEEIDRIFKINVYAHFWTLEAFLPIMKKKNSGHIVALSSCAGLFGIKNLAPYCASKFAVNGLMETVNEELRTNPNNQIKITIIFPYMTNTGLCKNPIIRFNNFMKLLNPTDLAKEIIHAQRTEVFQATVPGYLLLINNVARLYPIGARIAVTDFLDTYVDSDHL